MIGFKRKNIFPCQKTFLQSLTFSDPFKIAHIKIFAKIDFIKSISITYYL